MTNGTYIKTNVTGQYLNSQNIGDISQANTNTLLQLVLKETLRIGQYLKLDIQGPTKTSELVFQLTANDLSAGYISTYLPVSSLMSQGGELVDGSYLLSLSVSSDGGNYQQAMDQKTFIVDSHTPAEPENIELLAINESSLGSLASVGKQVLKVSISEANQAGDVLEIDLNTNGVTDLRYVLKPEDINSKVSIELSVEQSSIAQQALSPQVVVKNAAGNSSQPVLVSAANINEAPVAPIVYLDKSISIRRVYDDEGKPRYLKSKSTSDDQTPLLIGKLSEKLTSDQHINVLRDGEVIGQAVIARRGNKRTWRFEDKSNELVDGESYRYTAEIVDSNGAQSKASNTFVLNMSFSPPSQIATITDVFEKGGDRTRLSSGHITDKKTIVLNGTIDKALSHDQQLNVLIDGKVVGRATIDTTSEGEVSWSFTKKSLKDGSSYNFSVQVVNKAQMKGELSDNYNIKVDKSGLDSEYNNKLSNTFADPLIFDLDGDGIETLSIKQGVRFDHNSDGDSEHTGWVAADDGLLVRDLNNNGMIDNGAELFGDRTLLANGDRAASGFDALGAYDSNNDDVVDANDAQFSSLKIWQDANSDGVSQAQELKSLSDAGIQSISLSTTVSTGSDNDNLITTRSTYIKADNSPGEVADVSLKIGVKNSDHITINEGHDIVSKVAADDGISLTIAVPSNNTIGDAMAVVIVRPDGSSLSSGQITITNELFLAGHAFFTFPQSSLQDSGEYLDGDYRLELYTRKEGDQIVHVLPDAAFLLDTTPPEASDPIGDTNPTGNEVSIVIDSIAGDNILIPNEFEHGILVEIKGTVRGEFIAGDVVTIAIPNVATPFSTNVAQDGSFTILIPGSVLKTYADDHAGDDSLMASIIAHDVVGNVSAPINSPAKDYTINLNLVEVTNVDITNNFDSVVEGHDFTVAVTLSLPADEPKRHFFDLSGTSLPEDLGGLSFTNGVRFDPVTNELIVPAGVVSFEITIPTIDDSTVEPTETLIVNVGGVTAQGNIIDRIENDTDGDGVNDSIDLDDDNDGILDTVESGSDIGTNAFNVLSAEHDQAFSIGLDESVATDIVFNNDGTKMYIVGSNGDEVNEYALATAFDLTTQTLMNTFSVAGQETAPESITFNDDGTKMFVLGSAGDDINEYTLSSGFDTSTATFTQAHSISAQDVTPRSMLFNADGTKMYMLGASGDDIQEYLLQQPYSLSGMGVVPTTLSIGSQETEPTGMVFNHDGSKLYVIGSTGDDINIYRLTTPYSISRGHVFEGSFSVGNEATHPSGLAFNNDGTKLFVVGSTDDEINVYNIDAGFIANDVDADGIINSLDLDSDNDGITDNVEAQTTQGFKGATGTVSANGVDTAYTDSGLTAVDTDNDGTADYIDKDSDNDGFEDIVERDVTGANSITSTTDTDNDGLLDIFEDGTTNDGYNVHDSNVELAADNTASKFNLDDTDDDIAEDGKDANGLIKNFDYREDPSLDTDNDGILNSIDVDDDNDGILDTVEDAVVHGPEIVWEPVETLAQWQALETDGKLNLEGAGLQLITSGYSGLPGIQFNRVSVDTLDSSSANISLGDADENKLVSVSLTVRKDSPSNTYPGAVKGIFELVDVDGNVVDSVSWTAMHTGATYGAANNETITLSGEGRGISIRIRDDGSAVTSTYDDDWTVADISVTEQTIQIPDADGDGIINSLDLDSDNDGITDNVEAQTTQGYQGPSGIIGTNGLDTAYGAGIGAGLAAVDTDEDGIADYQDQDSDNDGVLDVAERGGTGPDNNANKTDTDRDGLLDSFEGSNLADGYNVNDENVTVDGTGNAVSFNLTDTDNDAGTDGKQATGLGRDFDYRENPDVDPDNDGIANKDDLDDDNDGILDTVENGSNIGTNAYNVLSAMLDTAYSVSDEEITPSGMTFNADGTKLYIVGTTGDDVNEYELANPYELASKTLVNTFSVSAQEVTPESITFSADGTQMFITGSTGYDINEYRLNTAFDTSTASFITAHNTQPQDYYPREMLFNPEGTRMFVLGAHGDDITEYILATPYDLSTRAPVSTTLSVSAQGTEPTGMAFNHDGTQLYVVGTTGDKVDIYQLTTPFSTSNGSRFAGSFVVGSEELTPTSITFNADGTQLFILGSTGDDITVYDIDAGFVANDVDGDGIINSLDLDSDNDGITDNVEAQTTEGYRGPSGVISANGVDTAYTDSGLNAVDTDNDGTADYIDKDSDNDGFEDIVERDVTGANSITFTTDTDNDGLLDIFEDGTTNDGYNVHDSNVELAADKSASKFNLGDTDDDIADDGKDADGLARNFDYRENPSIDTDNDGIINAIDVDDDNDGILDTDEMGSDIGDNAYNVRSASFEGRYSIGDEESAPTGMVFNADGTKLFVIGSTGDDINEYRLDSPFDLANKSLLNSFSVGTEETLPTGITFSEDGTKMFVIGSTGDDVNEYTLGTGFDTSTATFETRHSIAAQETVPSAMQFSDDGRKMFVIGSTGDDITEYLLPDPYDVANRAPVSSTFSVAAQENLPSGMSFNHDGTQLYVIGTTSDSIHVYELPNAYSISNGARFTGSFSVADQELTPQSIAFNNDGTQLFVLGSTGDDITVYDIEAGFISNDVDNDGIINSLDLDSDNDGVTDNVEAQTTQGYQGPSGIIGANGLDTAYGAGLAAVDTDEDGTADYKDLDSDNDGVLDVAERGGTGPDNNANKTDTDRDGLLDSFEGSNLADGYNVNDENVIVDSSGSAVSFNLRDTDNDAGTDGKQARGLGRDLDYRENPDVDPDNDGIANEDDLDDDNDGILDTVENATNIGTNAYNVRSATLDAAHSVSDEEITPSGMTFNADGTKLYIIGTTGDDVNEYELASPYELASKTLVNTFSVRAQEATPESITFNADGTKMFITGSTGYDINEYRLNTAFDTSTASFTTAHNTQPEDYYPREMLFNPEGTRMFVLGAHGDDITEYILGTAFDLSTRAPVSTTFSVSAQGTEPTGMAFNHDGSQLYVVGTTGDKVDIYELTNPFSISSGGSFAGSFVVSDEELTPTSITFNADGTQLFILGSTGDDITVYDIDAGFVANDVDGDGIINSLDLDSDNDGITDNVEAQTTEGYKGPSGIISANGVDEAYTGGLTPVDTDNDGTADYIDQDSDNDGVRDIVERDMTGVDSITSTVDTDSDGLLDIFESNTINDGYNVSDNNVELDAAGNVVEFNLADSNNNLAADGSDADGTQRNLDYREDINIDTDGDGVLNVDDIDDDNDGILDINEDGDITKSTPVTLDPVETLAQWRALEADGKINIEGNDLQITTSGYSGLPGIQFNGNNVDTLDTSSATISLADADENKLVSVSLTVRRVSPSNSYPGVVKGKFDLVDVDGNVVDSVSWTAKHTGGTYGAANNETIQLEGEGLGLRVVIRDDGSTGGSWADDWNVAAIAVTERLGQDQDVDRDGLINSLDLDSDNDGIGDNVEGQTTAGFIAPLTFVDVDGDGLNDIYDKDITNKGAAESEGIIAVNSDSDEIEDYKDTDSDNDEKSDVDESGLGAHPGSRPTYANPNGSIADPAVDLQNSNTTPEVDYRDFDVNNLVGDGVIANPLVVNHTGRAIDNIAVNIPELTLIDDDGSEILLLHVSGLDIGFRIFDNQGNTFTATAGDTSVEISSWNLDSISYRAPTNVSSSTTFDIIATSQETANLATSAPTFIQMNFGLTRYVPPPPPPPVRRHSDPLILDLDEDGVKTVSVEEGVKFDINSDGIADETGWVDKNDGLLVHDVNGNGIIDDGSELFGDETLKSDGTKAANGFEALRDLDSNFDNVFNAQDDAYSDLRVWKDENSDGVSQEHELYSLLDVGVESINLVGTGAFEENQGNWVGLRSSWKDADGKSHDVDDVWFNYKLGKNNVLDLSDLLEDESVDIGNLDQYLHFEQQGDNLVVYIDDQGSFAGESFNKDAVTDTIVLHDAKFASTEYDDVMKELINSSEFDVLT